RPVIEEKILKPVILEGKMLADPGPKAAVTGVTEKVTDSLINASTFGRTIVTSYVQKEMDNERFYKNWMVTAWRGKGALHWETLRESPKGKIAEDYIKTQIERPMFLGNPLPKEELARRKEEANRLVRDAILSYKK